MGDQGRENEGMQGRTLWAVYPHEGVLKIWHDGALVGEVPQKHFAKMIAAMAKALADVDDGH